ncbi:hypothetical protein A0H81_03151 [Grifola frondosa]|uniref:Uncharacterized protein n=1 Tax=Grifola frondosa TaxID=5627 RepID=A0A1C7MJP7_GRIFR|nr:hypothetical protein A0H81_03151 [Grifola frondosa]
MIATLTGSAAVQPELGSWIMEGNTYTGYYTPMSFRWTTSIRYLLDPECTYERRSARWNSTDIQHAGKEQGHHLINRGYHTQAPDSIFGRTPSATWPFCALF